MRIFVCGFAALFLSTATAHAQSGPELPPGPNRDLVYGQCRTCHDLQYLKESAGIPRSAWSDILDSMKQYGLRIPAAQRDKILDYLATYLGPNPPPKAAAQQKEQAATPDKIDAAALFAEQCSACHQPNGQGVPGQFPPLAGNRDLFLSRTFPARVVLGGFAGKIVVNGTDYDSVMPSFGHLSDAQIAAVVRYVRQAWGNDALRPKDMKAVDAAAVAGVRKENPTPQDVHKRRQELEKAAKQ